MSTIEKNKFIHLRNYTQFSLSKGALRISDLVDYCKKYSSPAIAISDFNNLFGSMEFSLGCIKNGIQPIISCNIKVNENEFNNFYILLIASSRVGYENLSKLVTSSYISNKKLLSPEIKLESLKRYNEGIICLSGGNDGLFSKNLSIFGKDRTTNIFDRLIGIFNERMYIEIQRDNFLDNDKLNDFLINLSINRKIPLVATNENYFLNEEFHESHDALICISQQTYVDSEKRLRISKNSYLKKPNEMLKLFRDLPEATLNTSLIAQKCSFILEEKSPTLPIIEGSQNENDFLKTNALKGLNQRFKELDFSESEKERYKKRLLGEIKIISNMGYSGYFLIVADFIQWAKNNKVPVGPGRGSGAGSLVAWSLTITNLDPIKFGLLFERFLNPERVSMPDFDIDFCMDKRDEVIKYVQIKYGEKRVAQIITFGSFQARAALRDVGRVLQIPYDQVDKICKLIPFNPANPLSLVDVVKNDKKIQEIIKQDNLNKKLFKISIDLEGLLRHVSTHAAGVVISDKNLVDILPLYREPRSNFPVTQFSMKYVEKAGLVKFDFLGLKTLTVIDKTCKLINNPNLNIDNISLTDTKTFELLKNGQTTGVFQFDGKGMRETLCQIKPVRFEDLIAIVSLYRPGPMDNIPLFIKRKNNKEKIEYIHENIKNILDETYGIMVYQEQVMQIAQKVAGFSLAKADLLRRAMGKKIKSEMDAQRNNFIEGCLRNKISKEKAIVLFNEIEKFAGYGFNKSHAAAYALIAYQTAYLKANHPVEFLCASMECEKNNVEKISVYCTELKNLGFQVFKPDINESYDSFRVIYADNGDAVGINYALGAIKNIGENSIKHLVKEREENGKFLSIIDILKRLNNNVLNKRQLESLIYSGSLSSVESNSLFLDQNISNLIQINSSFHNSKNLLQQNLFSEEKYDFLENKSDKDWDVFKKLEMEYESIGFYLSNHPIEYCKEIIKYGKYKSLDLISKLSHSNFYDQKTYTSLVIIKGFVERKSKSGKKYAFVEISDLSMDMEILCFSDTLSNLDSIPDAGDICEIKLELMNNNDQTRMVLTNLKKIDIRKNFDNFNLEVKLNLKKLDFRQFKTILDESVGGHSNIKFITEKNGYNLCLESNSKFSINVDLLNKLKKTSGIDEVIKIN